MQREDKQLRLTVFHDQRSPLKRGNWPERKIVDWFRIIVYQEIDWIGEKRRQTTSRIGIRQQFNDTQVKTHFGRETSVFEQSQKVRVLAMDITTNFDWSP